MKYVTSILAAIALIAIVIFSIQNLEAIDVSFLVWSMSISKVIVIIGAYVLGMISGWGLVELTKRRHAVVPQSTGDHPDGFFLAHVCDISLQDSSKLDRICIPSHFAGNCSSLITQFRRRCSVERCELVCLA